MVADPHAIDRGGLVRLIEREKGFAVVGEAASVDEALQECGTLSPDVLLVSLSLPEQRDDAVIPVLLRRLPDLPIVALSDRGAINCVVLNPPARRRATAKPIARCPVVTDCLALAAAQGARATVRRDADPEDLSGHTRCGRRASWYDRQTRRTAANGSGPSRSDGSRRASERELTRRGVAPEGLSNKEIPDRADQQPHGRHGATSPRSWFGGLQADPHRASQITCQAAAAGPDPGFRILGLDPRSGATSNQAAWPGRLTVGSLRLHARLGPERHCRHALTSWRPALGSPLAPSRDDQ